MLVTRSGVTRDGCYAARGALNPPRRPPPRVFVGTARALPLGMTKVTAHQRSLVRAALGLSDGTPVHVVPGTSTPRLSGEGYYWTWGSDLNGTRVRTAAGRAKYRTTYWPSTWLITVGADWVRYATDADHRARMGRVRVASAGRVTERSL